MFYQTRWFYSICAAALVGMGAWRRGASARRGRRVALAVAERLRMSREIHDTLLQSLFGVGLQLDAAAHQLRDSPSFVLVRAHLQRIQRQIEDYISEARQSIWDLRSPTLERRNLVEALQHTGDRLTAGKVQFVLTVTGAPRPSRRNSDPRAPHRTRGGLNAVRHADAQRVEMEIGFDDRLLRLRVADNGRGFDARQTRKAGSLDHYGLMSMEERAADAGGRCTIECKAWRRCPGHRGVPDRSIRLKQHRGRPAADSHSCRRRSLGRAGWSGTDCRSRRRPRSRRGGRDGRGSGGRLRTSPS